MTVHVCVYCACALYSIISFLTVLLTSFNFTINCEDYHLRPNIGGFDSQLEHNEEKKLRIYDKFKKKFSNFLCSIRVELTLTETFFFFIEKERWKNHN